MTIGSTAYPAVVDSRQPRPGVELEEVGLDDGPLTFLIETLPARSGARYELIDRTDREVKTILLRLARGRVAAAIPQFDTTQNGDWHAALARWGLPAPDGSPLTVEGIELPLAWRTRLAAAAIGSVNDQARAAAEALGFAVAILPEVPGDSPPPQLVDLLGQSA